MINGRRQPSCGGTSRMNRAGSVRGSGVKFPGPTRQKERNNLSAGSSCSAALAGARHCSTRTLSSSQTSSSQITVGAAPVQTTWPQARGFTMVAVS